MAAKVAVITGAGRGLGRAEAEELAGQGFDIVVNDIDLASASDCRAAVERLGRRAVVVTGDAASADVATSLVDAAVDTFGGLGVVINNAGVTADRMVFNLSDDDWDSALRVNLRSTFVLTRAAARRWRAAAKCAPAGAPPPGGRIVNTTSRSGLFGNPGQANYAAAKAGVASLTLVAARELRPYGVTCNAIAPRAYTAMMTHALGQMAESNAKQWPPEAVARFVAVLASDRASQVTGQVFIVYGSTVELVQPWASVARADDATTGSLDERADALARLFAGRDTAIGDFRARADYPLVDTAPRGGP